MGPCLGYALMEGAFAQEGEAAAPIHEPFEPLNFVVESFHHALAPGTADAREHRGIIVPDPGGKTDQFGDARGFGGVQPPGQRRGPVVQEHRAKLPNEGIRLAVQGVSQHLGQRSRGVAGQKRPPGKKPVRHFVCGRPHLFPPGSARAMAGDPAP